MRRRRRLRKAMIYICIHLDLKANIKIGQEFAFFKSSDACEEEQRRVYNDVLSKLPKFPIVYHKVSALIGLANYIPSSLRHEFTHLCFAEAKCADSGNNQMHFMTELALSSAPSSDQKSEIVAEAIRNAALIKDLPACRPGFGKVVRRCSARYTKASLDPMRAFETNSLC